MDYSKSYRIYPHFENNRFANFKGEKQENILRSGFQVLESLLLQTRGLKKIRREWVLKRSIYVHDKQRTSPHPLITWIGHATFIIQVSGLTIVTDPVFGDLSAFCRRIVQPGIALDHLPEVDVVVISHNHRDHLHPESLRFIVAKNPAVQFLVPIGDKRWFEKHGFKNVSEYTWWEEVFIPAFNGGDGVQFTFLPAIHWSCRSLFDRNKSLWGSWMIESPEHTLYFAGDTAYGEHFKAIAQEFPRIDTVLMPIGPCEPSEDMRLTHVNAEEAGQAFLDLNARCLIPMHWGVYWFGTDYPLLPLERLRTWWKKKGSNVKNRVCSPLKFGQSFLSRRAVTSAVAKAVHSVTRTSKKLLLGRDVQKHTTP